MCKCVRNIVCIFVVALMGFTALSLWGGGDKLREAGDRAEGVIREGAYKLADKADGIRQTADGIAKTVKKWSGTREEEGDSPHRSRKEPKKEEASERKWKH